MPIDPLLDAAIAEAYAAADQDIQVYYTVEISHRTFTEPARLLRYPLDGPEPKQFVCRLEKSAVYNPGQLVTFLGVPFDVALPEKSAETPGEFTFTVPGVGDLLDERLENAAMGGGIITAVFREFVVGEETSGPASWWPGINLRSPRIDPGSGNLIAIGTVLDWINRRYGGSYTPGKYPALVG